MGKKLRVKAHEDGARLVQSNTSIFNNGWLNGSDDIYLEEQSPDCPESDEDDVLNGITQWTNNDGRIVPAANTFHKLEKGYYVIRSCNSLGMYFEKQTLSLNKLYRLPNEASDLILNDISKFWTLEDTYKKYNRVFRRNYLLYSAPGTGKTSLINLMCEELIEKYNGIILSIDCSSSLSMVVDAIPMIRKIEPDRKIICIIEDIDAYVDSRADSYILNILDGNFKFGGVVFIATTNHIEQLEDRYVNRPSRFDRVVEFPLPNYESRKIFIEKSVLPEDLAKIDLDKWVKRTEGFTIDHINELILLFFVFGHSEEEAFETIEEMAKRKGGLKNKTSTKKNSTIGFNQ